jgi:hypothetical protein
MVLGSSSPTWRIYLATLRLVWGKTNCGRDGCPIRKDHAHQDCIENGYNHYNLAFLKKRPVIANMAEGLREYQGFIASRFLTAVNQGGRYTVRYHWNEINSFCSRKSLNPGEKPRLFEPIPIGHAQPGTNIVFSVAMMEYFYGRIIPALDQMEKEGWRVESSALRLWVFGHLSYDLIAMVMDVKATTVNNWIRRGRAELARRCPEIAEHVGWGQPSNAAHRPPVQSSEIPPVDREGEGRLLREGIA